MQAIRFRIDSLTKRSTDAHKVRAEKYSQLKRQMVELTTIQKQLGGEYAVVRDEFVKLDRDDPRYHELKLQEKELFEELSELRTRRAPLDIELLKHESI